MDSNHLDQFVTSCQLAEHPLKRAKKQTNQLYYRMLAHTISQCAGDSEYTNARLKQYRVMLAVNTEETTSVGTDRDKTLRAVLNPLRKPWLRKLRLCLICDVALISINRDSVDRTRNLMERFLSKRQLVLVDTLVGVLFADTDDAIPQRYLFLKASIEQFRANYQFVAQSEIRVFITANMSAGKSTLINAIIGKPITQTSQETCTANLSYLFDKPFEDHAIHLLNSPLNLNVSYNELRNLAKTDVSLIASYFRRLVPARSRVCLIDSPGVNSVIHQNHGALTCKALADEQYDKLVYVLNANKLGTDEELRYLKYIAANVAHQKVLFVLNKLDDFKHAEDSIAQSFQAVYHDLYQLGYENPIICPLSAYCAWLVKMKQNSEELTEDEEDVCQFYLKKFSRAECDLSVYYPTIKPPLLEDVWTTLAVKCGLYGFENILYGGTVQ